MPDPNTHKYTASAFKYVNHPNGAALFFDLDGQPPPREWRAQGNAIYRVTIEEVKNKLDLEGAGFRTQNTAIIELFRDEFRRLVESLQPRDLRAAPIAFEFQVDQDGSLQDVRIDGKPIGERVGRPSGFVSKDATPTEKAGKSS